jgi:hypothetical protein
MSSGLNLKRPDFLARLLVCPDHLGGYEVTQRLAQPVQGKLDPSGDMKTPPKIQVDTTPADKFFTHAAELWRGGDVYRRGGRGGEAGLTRAPVGRLNWDFSSGYCGAARTD